MRLVRVSLLWLVPILGLCACSVQEAPAPTPRAAYLGTTPAYERWVKEQVLAYWQLEPDAGVIPLVHPLTAALSQAEEGGVEILIAATLPPEGWFATPLLRDGIALVVHPKLQIRDLSSEALYAIFFGREGNWSAFGEDDLPIQPIIPLEGDEIRSTFERLILRGARFSSSALLAPHPSAALELVRETPGSITFVPFSSLEGGQAAIAVDGIRLTATTAEDGSYPLTLDLIATAPAEPNDQMRQFLGWLQASLQSSP